MVFCVQERSLKVRDHEVCRGQEQLSANVCEARCWDEHLALLICLRCVATWVFTHPSVKPQRNLALRTSCGVVHLPISPWVPKPCKWCFLKDSRSVIWNSFSGGCCECYFLGFLKTGNTKPEKGMSVCMWKAVEAPDQFSHELFARPSFIG